MMGKKAVYLFCLLFLFFLLQAYFLPITSHQEARRALIALESKYNPLFPTLNGEPYLVKPPLHPTLASPLLLLASALNLGVDVQIFLLRFLSLLAYVGTSYIVFLLLEKDLRQSLIAIFILFSSYRFLSFALRIDLEPPFVFFCLLSFYLFVKYERERKSYLICAFYIVLSLASLVRGPLNLLLIFSLFLYAVLKYKKQAISFLKPHGLILYLFPQALWYGLAYLKFGEEPFQEFILDLKTRTAGKGDPFYYYFLSLGLNFLPYLLLLLLKARSLLKIDHQGLLLYFIPSFMPLLILSFTGEKFDKYLLFIYPIFAILLAKILLNLYSERLVFYATFALFILNFLACSLSYVLQITSLRPKIMSLQKSIPCQERVCFFDEPSYLFNILCERKIPKCKPSVDLVSALVIMGTSCGEKGYQTRLTLKDPYKEKNWYFCVESEKEKLPPKD
ncbi:MAG: phospholipid carrier-dependent glycosyltransferase [Thermodesulfobacterium sp.]|jgi:4-amino-4-deoxy-L-arabinose transferase-like glycosyltransferase|nr:phospholipid carrier-dependent glycosyltransferase [Thermodesulfobacterium sp.]